jgi:hypothetical protein
LTKQFLKEIIMSSQKYSTTKSCSTSFLFLLLSLLLQVICSAQTAGNHIYHENLEQTPPKDCHKVQRLPSSFDDVEDCYRLIVDLPKTVSRKNLNIDINYEKGLIEIFGWWMEQKVRGEMPKKMCAYQEWSVDLEWLEQDYSLYDLVMQLDGQKVIVSLPKVALQKEEDGMPVQEYENSTYFVARNLWKMVRGLARLNSSLHNSTLTNEDQPSLTMWDSFGAATSQEMGNQSAMQYLRSRQVALERFLKFSLGGNDEESYWLKKM